MWTGFAVVSRLSMYFFYFMYLLYYDLLTIIFTLSFRLLLLWRYLYYNMQMPIPKYYLLKMIILIA